MRWFGLGVLTACGSGVDTEDSDTDLTVEDADADTDADADADTDADSDTDTDTDTDPTGVLPWRHTITVDGSASDWLASERFDTTTGAGTSAWITWDDTHLFVAVQHPDVAGGASHWLVLNLGSGGAGSSIGASHGSQAPELAMEASHVLRRKADGSFDSLLSWNGSAWEETPSWLSANGAVGEDDGASFLELAVPRVLLGGATQVDVQLAWVYEGAGYESTYAGVPSSCFVDGYDPDYLSFFRFDLDGAGSPQSYAPRMGASDTALPTDTAGPHTDTAGPPTDTAGPPTDTAPLPWRHTITLDGRLDDWFPSERFETSQGAPTATYVTWDDTSLFIGVQHPDVTSGGAQHWVVVTLGGGSGASVGTSLGTQEPSLPFAASQILRWKADGSYADRLAWDGSGWGVAGVPRVAEDDAGGVVELAADLADLGLSDRIDLHVAWVYEGAGFESSFAAVPAGSFPQGAYDPDYGQYLSFDRARPEAPSTYGPLP